MTTLANRVVSYRNSTSNHNSARRSRPAASLYLIEILHQTTTDGRAFAQQTQLYLIEILHQTTTKEVREESREVLYLIEILHQTTTSSASDLIRVELYLIEILHQTTTSPLVANLFSRCILSKFYIKPQLFEPQKDQPVGCILSKFYIKPQLHGMQPEGRRVVSYRNSTSNHNCIPFHISTPGLYLIEILHQTTTPSNPDRFSRRCILSKFYIKPQQFYSIFFS